MKVYVIVGVNRLLENTSARAVYSRREDAEAHLLDKKRMWFDDHAVMVEHEIDAELSKEVS
jgi:hypothetical protein